MAEINKIETKKTIQRLNEKKSWFFQKINKTDKHLSKLKAEKEYSNYQNQKWKGGYSNRYGGNIGNHQVIFCKPVLHKIGKLKGNGQLSG